MITFIPKRPEELSKAFYHSEASHKALDFGFHRYTQIYFEKLGSGYYTQHEAESFALNVGQYAAMLDLLSYAERTAK